MEEAKLYGTDILANIDETLNTLDGIKSRMLKVIKAKDWEIWKNGELEKILSRCEQDLESAQSRFNVKTQLTMVTFQRDMNVKVEVVQDALSRLGELLSAFVEKPTVIEQEGLRHERTLSISRSPWIADELVDSPESSTPPTPTGDRYVETGDVDGWQRVLYNYHVLMGAPPTLKVINGEVTRTSDMAVDGGVYSDIWQGLYLNHGKVGTSQDIQVLSDLRKGAKTVSQVALKGLRNTTADDPRSQERFRREVEIWSRLKHDHILQLYGIVTNVGKHIHMVSPWQANGNILKYVENHPYINRLGLMGGAASGLEYLHANMVVHGNMKCGEACISDFGLSELVEEVTSRNDSLESIPMQQEGSTRWLAPELIKGLTSTPTFASDTYSFAMALLELITGKHPYAEKKRIVQVIQLILGEKMPLRPGVIRDDRVWEFLLQCWQHEATLRPSMERRERRAQSHGGTYNKVGEA
ncbi:hypothetical protein NMY22_g17981 [Coprinellus aureogranulatus]|nr:hypothetical protein NMY22_g17981 [Coprinellus aureogranulatus]